MIRNKFENLISIIIANRNGEKYLQTCLASILKSSIKNYEIIIIDNNSTDHSIEIINKFASNDSRIRLFKNRINQGVPFSRNKAIKSANGDILVFLDNDTKVDKNWLKGILQTFATDEEIGSLQCKIFDFHKPSIIQEIGMKLYSYTGFGTPVGRGEKDHGQFSSSQPIIALGAAMAVRKEIAKKIGGFDLKLIHTTDDLDFSWRVWIAGYKVLSSPSSVIYHYTKVHNSSYKMYFHLCKNSLRMTIKNYDLYNAFKYVPCSLMFNLVGGFYVLFSRGNFNGIGGVLLGIAWSIWNLPDTLQQRSRVQSSRRVNDNYIFEKIMMPTNLFSIFKTYFRIAKKTDSLMRNRE